MTPIHTLCAIGAATCKAACLALVMLAATPAHAEDVVRAAGRAAGSAQGPWAGRSAFTAHGDHLSAAGQRRFAADDQGNASAVSGSGLRTTAGGQGLRTRSFNRSADGSVAAHNQASATTAHGGSASSQSSLTRYADGSASGERGTTLTNADTGVTFDGSTSYTKGSGFSRSASCKDAAGSVSCGSAR